MGYISDLRKKIGHQPILMPAGCVLFLNEKKQLLLQKRADNGCWAYPGGAMELGESFEECAAREAFEETGLECLNLKEYQCLSGADMYHVYPNGDEIYSVEMVFLCTKYRGELKIQEEEVTEQCFFDLNALPEQISPHQVGVIARLAKEVQEKTFS